MGILKRVRNGQPTWYARYRRDGRDRWKAAAPTRVLAVSLLGRRKVEVAAGYVLRGRVQRCVAVKGVWDAPASSGVRLTGHDLLIARQMAGDYWICVVDECRRGGTVYGIYQDPARLFGDVMRDMALVRIPGSALKAGRREASPA